MIFRSSSHEKGPKRPLVALYFFLMNGRRLARLDAAAAAALLRDHK
jgi:hypothetical protein